MIKYEEVRPVQVSLYCDDCDCEMKPDGRCLASSPPQYPHVCVGCGVSVNVFGKTYPYIDFLT